MDKYIYIKGGEGKKKGGGDKGVTDRSMKLNSKLPVEIETGTFV